jgi:hypothetical protein
MPSDMAVEGPDARVVCGHLPYHVAPCWHYLHVTALRVRWVDDGPAVPSAESDVLLSKGWLDRMESGKRESRLFGMGKTNGSRTNQDEHIVTVEMHGMRCRCEIVDDEPVASITTSIVDVPFSI